MSNLITKITLDNSQFVRALNLSKSEIEKFKTITNSTDSFFGGLTGGGIAKFAGIAAIAGTVGTSIYHMTSKAISNFSQFEESLSHLASLTGLGKDAMDKLKDSAQLTGGQMAKSGAEIADAYSMVGSKMPDLLQSPEALDHVTRAAITLAKAGVMPLEEATNSLVGIMNQMGAGAEQANIYINVLANGSKLGAGNITYLSQAFDKCGAAVKNAGLSIEQGTALIEMLAKKTPSAEIAGTQLRNTLLILATQSDSTINPKIVGLNKALENLSKKSNDSAFMLKLFGRENYNAAVQLAQNASQVAELTTKLGGTNEAEKQAAINADNLASSSKKLSADWNNLLTSIGDSSAWKTMISWIDKAVKSLDSLFSNNKTKVKKAGTEAGNNVINQIDKDIERDVSKGGNRNMAYNRAMNKAKRGGYNIPTSSYSNLTKETEYYDDGLGRMTFSKKARDYNNNLINNIRKEANKSGQSYIKSLMEQNANSTSKISDINNNSTSKLKKSSNSSNNNDISKSVIESYEQAIRKLEDDKSKYIKLGINTDAISTKIFNLRKDVETIKLNLIDDSTIDGLKTKLSQLEKLQSLSKTKNEYDSYTNKIESVKKKISEIDGSVYIHVDKDSESDLIDKINKLENQIKNTSDISIKVKLTVDKEDFERKLKEVQQLDNPISKPIKKKYDSTFDYKLTDTDKKKGEFERENDYLKEMIEYNKKAADSFKFSDKAISNQTDKVNKLDKAWKKSEINDDIKEYQKNIKSVKFNLFTNGVGNSINILQDWYNLGKNLKNSNPFEAITSIIGTMINTAQGIVSIINLFKELSTATTLLSAAKSAAAAEEATTAIEKVAAIKMEVAANSELAASEYMAAHASIPFAGYAIGAGFVASSMATIKAAGIISAFKNGGIVGGNSYVGDKLLAAVNSGEMILNQNQQRNLFNAINNNRIGNTANGGEVSFKISGQNLVGVLSNYNKKISKTI